MRYEINEQLDISCYNLQGLKILSQPSRPDGLDWASRQEAEEWIQAWIKEQEAASLVVPKLPLAE